MENTQEQERTLKRVSLKVRKLAKLETTEMRKEG
jgi:hypothetical protein